MHLLASPVDRATVSYATSTALTLLHVVPFFINEPVHTLFFFIVRKSHIHTSFYALVDSSFNATLLQEPPQNVIYFLSVIDRS